MIKTLIKSLLSRLPARRHTPANYTELIACLQKGMSLYVEEKYAEAVRELDKALAPNKTLSTDETLGNRHYIFIRALANGKNGNYNRAIKDFTTILKADPEAFEILYNRGFAYASKSNYNKAIEDWTAALKIKPDYPEALFNRGTAYSHKGNLDKAIEDWEAALRIDPNYESAKKNLEWAYKKKREANL